MGLYLCVYKDDVEVDGVEVGLYDDFAFFRNVISEKLENGETGARYPTLMLHSDCDGEWTVEEAFSLESELSAIREIAKSIPPVGFNSKWQEEVAKSLGIKPANLCEVFIDVDGESLVDRILYLCQVSQRENEPILFQ